MPTTTIKADDVSLLVDYNSRALDEPDSKKPTLIFAHGFPDNHTTWSEQVAALQDDFHIATFDLRGVGGSSAPRDESGYQVERVLPDYAAVIDFMVGPAGKAHLVGHDWGACLGWRFVSEPRYASRLLSYTGIAGPHADLAFRLNMDRLRSLRPADVKEALTQFGKSWYVGFFQLPLIPEALLNLAPQPLWQLTHRRGGAHAGDPILKASREEILAATLAPLNLYRQLCRKLAKGEVVIPPETVRLPCQLIVPDRDLALRPSIYENMSAYFGSLEIHHLDANHWVHRDRPAVINELIRGFIARHA